jgi:hypothetical protein
VSATSATPAAATPAASPPTAPAPVKPAPPEPAAAPKESTPPARAAAANETATAEPAVPVIAIGTQPTAEVVPPAPLPPARAVRPHHRAHPGLRAARYAHKVSGGVHGRGLASSRAGGGGCVVSIASSPWTDVWIDNHKTGRRTPLDGYHVSCGSHEVILNRDDLGLFKRDVITVQAGLPFKKTYPLR